MTAKRTITSYGCQTDSHAADSYKTELNTRKRFCQQIAKMSDDKKRLKQITDMTLDDVGYNEEQKKSFQGLSYDKKIEYVVSEFYLKNRFEESACEQGVAKTEFFDYLNKFQLTQDYTQLCMLFHRYKQNLRNGFSENCN
jgi:hypothetical protein